MKVPFFDYKAFAAELPFTSFVQESLDSGFLIGGPKVSEFEEALQSFTGIKHVISVANATDALEIIFEYLNLPRGSKVLVPAHTMIATASAVDRCGLEVVPIDVDPISLVVTSYQLSQINLSEISAFVCTQLNGICSDMDAILRILDDHNIILIEDSADGIGSFHKNSHAGSFGIAGCLSFYPAKVLGCLGDGGAILTNSDDMNAFARSVRDHGRGPDLLPIHWGRNSRLDSIQANILLHKLPYLNDYIETRRDIARLYDSKLSDLEETGFIKKPVSTSFKSNDLSTYQNYEIRAVNRDQLQSFLTDKGIGTIRQWGGFSIPHMSHLGFDISNYPETENLFNQLLLLPMNHLMSLEQAEFVCDHVNQFYSV